MAAISKITNFGYSIAIVGIVVFQHSNSDFTKLRVPDSLVHVVPSNETFRSRASTVSTARCHCVFTACACESHLLYHSDSKHSWNGRNIRTDARYQWCRIKICHWHNIEFDTELERRKFGAPMAILSSSFCGRFLWNAPAFVHGIIWWYPDAQL